MTSINPNPPRAVTSWRVACLGPVPEGATALAAVVATVLPEAAVEVVDFAATANAPEADLFVLDASTDPVPALEQLRTLRARGAGAPAIVVGPDVPGRPATIPASLGDTRLVDPGALSTALPNAVADAASQIAAVTAHPGLGLILRGLQETRQLIAAGQIARRVKHDINNPLAALMAEAQLLELEDLHGEVRDAVARIVELARRVVAEARRLEGPRTGAG